MKQRKFYKDKGTYECVLFVIVVLGYKQRLTRLSSINPQKYFFSVFDRKIGKKRKRKKYETRPVKIIDLLTFIVVFVSDSTYVKLEMR